MKGKLNNLVIVAFIISCVLFVACKRSTPSNVIKPKEMEEILYDYNMAQTMGDELSYEEDYKRSLYIDYVLQKHHITQAEFDSSISWYTRQAEDLSKIYENVNIRLKDRLGGVNHQIALRDRKPQTTAKGDTVNIWYADNLYCLNSNSLSNKLEFVMHSDENFNIHDAIEWKIRYSFLPDSEKNKNAIMTLLIKYDNDSVIDRVKQINKSGTYSIRLKSDSTYRIREIKGFVYHNGNTTSHSLLLDQITLTRYHKQQKEDKIKAVQLKPYNKVEIKENKTIVKQDSLKKESLDIDKIKPMTSIRLTPKEMSHPRTKK